MSNTASAGTLAPLIERVCTATCWVRRKGLPVHIDEPLTPARINEHLHSGVAHGVSPIAPGSNTTRCAVLDFDSHKGETPWPRLVGPVTSVIEALARRGIAVTPFRSSGGHGVHLIVLWDEPQDAYTVRVTLAEALADAGLKSGTKGVAAGEVEIFPKQDAVPANKFGSMFVLPFAGHSCLLALPDLEGQPRTTPFEWAISQPLTPREAPAIVRDVTPVTAPELDHLRELVDAIPNSGDKTLDYDTWRDVIFAIHWATNGSDDGFAIAAEFSARSYKDDAAFFEKRVWPYIDSTRPDAITIRTLEMIARRHGWTEDVSGDFEVVSDEEIEALAAASEAAPPPDGKGPRFPVIPAHEFANRPPPKWIVRDVLPQAELAVIFGESGSGKSFLALDIGMAIARGEPWRGHESKPGRVTYIAAEGAGGFRNRLRAYAHHHGVDLTAVPLGIIAGVPNFMLTDDTKAVTQAVMAAGGSSVIVVDTFAQVTPGANENAGEDVGKALSNCRRLHRATGALVVLVHHAGKDLTKGARGWSGLRAAADAEIEISRADDQRSATISKMKDGTDGVEFGFRLLNVTIGLDDDGREYSSCVVEHVEAPARASRPRQPQGERQRLVWAALNDVCDLSEGTAPVSVVLTETVNRMVIEPGEGGEGRRNRGRDVARRALQALADSGWCRINGSVVEICNQ